MGYYKVLSKPMDYVDATTKSKYKGLYRSEPFPKSDTNKRFMSLWYRYCDYYDPLKNPGMKNMGITTELTIDELKEFANLATQEIGNCFEVIYFSEDEECPHKSEYYGADVAGFGDYSMVGGGFLAGEGKSPLYDIIIRYFREKLNTHGLFNTDDAASFRAVLLELDTLDPGSIEDYDWRVLHVFRVL